MNLELDEEYGAGFEGTDELRKKYIQDTPGQRIQQFKTTMNQQTYKTYQEFATQHKKMYPTHSAEEIKKAWETYSKYQEETELEEAQNLVSKGIYTLDGKKIDGARSSKLFLQALDTDGFLHDLSWKEWSEYDLDDTSSDNAKKQFIDRLAKQIKMFNKRIDLNTWLKGGNRSFIDTVNYIFKLDPNIKYSKASGLKEDTVKEDADLEEAQDPKQKSDFQRVVYGLMKQDDYNKKWKLGKYRKPGNKLAGPGGLYKNLIMPSKRESELEETYISEVLKSSDPVEVWIDDFIKSDNAKFAGKTKKERINMALGAHYAAQKNESMEQQDISLSTRRIMKIVEIATKSKDSDAIYEFALTDPDYSSITKLKEDFNKYIKNL